MTFSTRRDPEVCAKSKRSCFSSHSNGSLSFVAVHWWAALHRELNLPLSVLRAAVDGTCHIYARNVIKNWKN